MKPLDAFTAEEFIHSESVDLFDDVILIIFVERLAFVLKIVRQTEHVEFIERYQLFQEEHMQRTSFERREPFDGMVFLICGFPLVVAVQLVDNIIFDQRFYFIPRSVFRKFRLHIVFDLLRKLGGFDGIDQHEEGICVPFFNAVLFPCKFDNVFPCRRCNERTEPVPRGAEILGRRQRRNNADVRQRCDIVHHVPGDRTPFRLLRIVDLNGIAVRLIQKQRHLIIVHELKELDK